MEGGVITRKKKVNVQKHALKSPQELVITQLQKMGAMVVRVKIQNMNFAKEAIVTVSTANM